MTHEQHDPTAIIIKMVNQIAANLGAYSHKEAAERVAQHVTRFWAPKMRQRLFEAAENHADLSPLVLDAIELLKIEGRRQSA